MTTDATATYSFPPSPPESPSGQVDRFLSDAFGYLDELYSAHGKMFTLELGALGNEGLVDRGNNGKWVFLTRPEQIRLMYSAPTEVASGADANSVFFGTNEQSVAYIDGEAHRTRRSVLQPLFSSAYDYSQLVQQVTREQIASWPVGREFPLFPELPRLSIAVIVDVVCGTAPAADRRTLAKLLPRTENARYSRQELVEADRAIRAHIATMLPGYLDRAAASGRDDVCASLLREAQTDESLTSEVIRDEIFSLLYTGFSTTANTLSWAIGHLYTDPAVRAALSEALRAQLGDGPITREDLAQVPYLDAVIFETLRLHPVTPLNGVRMLRQPYEIDGWSLPAGTILVHCAYLLQRSDEVFDAPAEFRPQRFLAHSPSPYEFGPFGGGSRTCVGRIYSRDEMRVILATLAREVTMEIPHGLANAQLQGFFMAPADGLRCVVRSTTA